MTLRKSTNFRQTLQFLEYRHLESEKRRTHKSYQIIEIIALFEQLFCEAKRNQIWNKNPNRSLESCSLITWRYLNSPQIQELSRLSWRSSDFDGFCGKKHRSIFYFTVGLLYVLHKPFCRKRGDFGCQVSFSRISKAPHWEECFVRSLDPPSLGHKLINKCLK